MINLIPKNIRQRACNKLAHSIGCLAFGMTLAYPQAYADGAIEEITVTARKRAESLQDVPIAITAFSGDSLTTNVGSPGKNTTYGNAPSQSDYDLFGAALILNWQVGDMEIKSITAYRDLDSAFGRDGDSSPIILDHTRNEYEHEQLSQELQFTGALMADRLKWLAGLYYFEEEGFDRVQVPLGLEVDLALTGVPGTVINLWLDEANDVENTSKAIFAQATYEISDNLT